MFTVGIGADRLMFLRMGELWKSSFRFAVFAAALLAVPPGSSPTDSRPASPDHTCDEPLACRSLCATSALPSARDLQRRSPDVFWYRQAKTRSCEARGALWTRPPKPRV